MTTIPPRDADRDSATTIFVCTTCRRKRPDLPLGYDLPGEGLASTLAREIARQGIAGVVATPVECLAVCNRPCTVAFAGPGKWTHIVGGLDPEAHMQDIIATARRTADTPDGIVPWAERPQSIRSGGIARVPPIAVEIETS